MFIDTATVQVKAGKGGNGLVSFRHEKFVDRGGPDGGDGGKGGDVIFVAQENVNTLANFRHNPLLSAENGAGGGKRNKRGKSGADERVVVPVGTSVVVDGNILVDLNKPGQETVVARGGDGGFGNAHFKSSRRQAPQVAELGEPGEEFEAQLELKLVADVGLVGLPNAGKSTFLGAVSNARPKIADYPFTTLVPNLGVVDRDGFDLVIADIPGLIEGASEGKGLGDEFLRHVERTGVLLHLIDGTSDTPLEDFDTITHEINNHQEIANKPRVIALTKQDAIDDEVLDYIASELKKKTEQEVYIISASAHQNINQLLGELQKVVDKHKAELSEHEQNEDTVEDIPVYELTPSDDDWRAVLLDGQYKVTGTKVEKFARRTDANNYHGKMRLFDILRRWGVLNELEKLGYDYSQKIVIGDKSFDFEDL